MIFIGVESKNAYSAETLEYIKWIKGMVEKLNWSFPAENISRELGLTNDESLKLIEIVNQNEVRGEEELKSLLQNPERLNIEMFVEVDTAKKISSAVAKVSVERVLELYKLPVNDIKSVLNIDYIRGEGDKFVVDKLIDPDKIDDSSVASMRDKVKSWNIYDKILFSEDDTLTVMSIEMNSIDINLRQMFNIEIEKNIKENPRNGLSVYLAGEPVVSDRVSSSTRSDLGWLLPFVLIVMLLILTAVFRHYEGVLFPMMGIIISIIWTIGTMAVLDIPMSMVSITVPTVLAAVASAYGIHFMTHYYMNSEESRYESSMESLRVSGLAIIMAALTTVVGFGSLATSDMTHIKNYGIITAIGVFYSLIISIVFIPVFLMLRKSNKPHLKFVDKEHDSADFSSRFLKLIRRYTGNRPGAIMAGGLLIIFFSIYGIKNIELSMNSMDFFQEGSDIKVAENHLNKKLAGTQILDINIESTDGSEVITPAILEKIENFQKDITSKYGDVGKTISVNDYLKKMNREMNGGKSEYNRLPDNAAMTREYMLLYSGDIDGVITRNLDKLRIHISIKRGKISDQMKIREYALAYFDEGFRRDNKVIVKSSGFMDLIMEANSLIVEGQVSSLMLSLAVVAILMALIFRSLILTVISMIPLVVGIAMNFGVMGLLGIPLNAVTSVVASISIGMGIDYSIHFINQYRVSYAESGDIDAAIAKTYEGTGRAILSNVVSVTAGFLVLMFSKFPIIQQFGGLIAFTVASTGFAAIIIIPAALKISGRHSKSIRG
jgi:hydrophobe/amphiphile efflux-3 (HAE3) family protein